ncbi:NYN domain-containing protein [Rhodoferax sp. U11-2br]|uniref:NYN domain-containing protein n=1 Tax=Rhodoferax sp. U11-2br TaxID=2838878 RepID=UPI001BE60659|nr:NYN domain-containing protein [Rhodoferax sp. U11-2br]MBT3066825.1 NYN domain-containing protein [Rhodoferax sp. U11-2br]
MNVFLIDADNLNSGAWVDEAFRVLQETEGPLPVRRAYGSAENLKSLADTLCAWAVRPFVNLALTKNTTDMALAVDAMELACQSPTPGLIVIGSGDADFTPLVVRLRERGIRVVCVSERSKMGREALPAYDRVILVGPEQGTAPSAPARKTARKTAAKTSSPAASPKPAAAKTPAKKVAAKTSTRTKAQQEQPATSPVPVPPPAPEKPAPQPAEGAAHAMPLLDLAAILAAVPALQTGQAQPLAAVAKALLDARLRGKNMTATKLLKKFPQQFVLAPPEKPRTVQYIPAPSAA